MCTWYKMSINYLTLSGFASCYAYIPYSYHSNSLVTLNSMVESFSLDFGTIKQYSYCLALKYKNVSGFLRFCCVSWGISGILVLMVHICLLVVNKLVVNIMKPARLHRSVKYWKQT